MPAQVTFTFRSFPLSPLGFVSRSSVSMNICGACEQKNGIRHTLRVALARVVADKPTAPLLWLAQYFLLRSLKAQRILFQERARTQNADADAEKIEEGQRNTDSDEYLEGMDGQTLRFTNNATVVLFGTRPYGKDPNHVALGLKEKAAAYASSALEKNIEEALSGLLQCRPASVFAWLAIEFCRQSPFVELVSWSGRVVNTSRMSSFIQEESVRHRRKQPKL